MKLLAVASCSTKNPYSVLRGCIHYHLKKSEAALADFKTAEAQENLDAETSMSLFTVRGAIYKGKGQVDAAIGEFRGKQALFFNNHLRF